MTTRPPSPWDKAAIRTADTRRQDNASRRVESYPRQERARGYLEGVAAAADLAQPGDTVLVETDHVPGVDESTLRIEVVELDGRRVESVRVRVLDADDPDSLQRKPDPHAEVDESERSEEPATTEGPENTADPEGSEHSANSENLTDGDHS